MNENTIVCPFCPLACDDIRVCMTDKPGTLPTIETTCEKSQQAFRHALRPAPPRIGDKVVSLGELKTHLAKRLGASRPVVVISGGVDLTTAKSLEQLDSIGKVTWLLDQSPLSQAWQRTSSRDGVITATLGDVREHADLLWFIGDPSRSAPRLKQILSNDSTTTQLIETPGPLDLDTLAALALATRQSDTASYASGISDIATAIESSKYFAVIVGDDAFAPQFADAATSLLVQWTWSLNAKRRAVVLSLDEAATNRSVYRWRTNRSLRSLDRASPLPATLIIRIGEPQFDTAPVDIAISSIDPGPSHAATFVPCATVGVHQAGAIVRGDGTVTMPLQKIASSELPSAAHWIEGLLTPRKRRGDGC